MKKVLLQLSQLEKINRQNCMDAASRISLEAERKFLGIEPAKEDDELGMQAARQNKMLGIDMPPLSPEVERVVKSMDLTTVQWESEESKRIVNEVVEKVTIGVETDMTYQGEQPIAIDCRIAKQKENPFFK